MIADTLKEFDIPVVSEIQTSKSLNELSLNRLFRIANTVSDSPIEINGNRKLAHVTLRYALLDAVKNQIDKLTPDLINIARDKAVTLTDKIWGKGFEHRPDFAEESDIDSDKSPDENPEPSTNNMVSHDSIKGRRGRKRSSDTFDRIKDIVRQNPDAEKDTVIALILEETQIAPNTATAYYYKARKSLSLETGNGRRGRKSTGVYDKIKAIIADNIEKPRDSILALLRSELPDLAKNTATTYYYKAKKELDA